MLVIPLKKVFMKKFLVLFAPLFFVTLPLQSMHSDGIQKSSISWLIHRAEKNPYTIATLSIGAALGGYWYATNDYEDRWNWDEIIIGDLIFPKDFKWGSANSCLQVAGTKTWWGDVQNNWTKYQQEKNIPVEKHMGHAAGHWKKEIYQKDFMLAHEFGLNTHRFSIEWSKIQPHFKGHFDTLAMQHYIEYVQDMIDAELEPMPTLFHHSWPLWFDELGAFEKAENIEHFVRFATYVFEAFKKAGLLEKTKLWLTFNEPAGYAAGAYIDGRYPPNKRFAVGLCGEVLKNMLDAHCKIYDEFKSRDNSIQISLAHAFVPIQPFNPWNPFDKFVSSVFNHLVNTVTLEYLSTGKFKWLYKNTENPKACNKLDFIGVNYYSHTLLGWFKERNRPNTITADPVEGKKAKAVYAEGFYQALKKVTEYFPHKAIFITENGFATDNAEHRKLYIDRHLYVLKKLIDEGTEIIGYLWWTLTDCYSWGKGNCSKHGLYEVDFKHSSLPRKLKPSSRHLQNIIKHNHEHYQQ